MKEVELLLDSDGGGHTTPQLLRNNFRGSPKHVTELVWCISGARRVLVGVELGSGIPLQLSFGIAAQSYGLPTRELVCSFTLAMLMFSIFVIAIALDVLSSNICASSVIGVSSQSVNCIWLLKT